MPLVLALAVTLVLMTCALRAQGMPWARAATAVIGCGAGFVVLVIVIGLIK